MNDERSPSISRVSIVLAVLLWVAAGGIVTFVLLFTHTNFFDF